MVETRTDPPSIPEDLKRELKRFLLDSETNDGGGGIARERFEAVAGHLQDLLAEQGEGHRKIDTWTGEKISPLAPNPEKIKLDDIAHGLANLCRFAGQGPAMYSVARHSVHVSLEVEARDGTLAAQRWGLLHDGAEAYLSDVPGPAKDSLPGYKYAERRLDRAIQTAMDLNLADEDKELVHEQADKRVGVYELAEQFPSGGHGGVELKHDPTVIDRMRDDEELFRRRAHELGMV